MKWVALCHDFEPTFSLAVSEMECEGYGLCHAELEWPIINTGGQDGQTAVKLSSMVCQFLSAKRIARSSVYPYLFSHVAGISWM